MNTITVTKHDVAQKLVRSLRGEYIISRALCALEAQLDAVTDMRHREPSDLADVRLLIDEVFPTFKALDGIEGKDMIPTSDCCNAPVQEHRPDDTHARCTACGEMALIEREAE